MLTLKSHKKALQILMLVLGFGFGIIGCNNSSPGSSMLRIVYYRASQPDQFTVGSFYTYDFNTHLAHPLTSNNVSGYTKSIYWSPAARRFAYAAGGQSQAEIYTTDIDGQETKRLTSNAREDTYPSWSPDGKQLAYTEMNEDKSGTRVYLMNADGTESHPLLRDSSISSGGGTAPWSPDGQLVAVPGIPISQPLYDKSVNIYVVDAKSGEIKYQLADESIHSLMAWSPDGQQLALVGSREGVSELFIWSLSDSKVKRVTDVKDVLNVNWSPDGRHLSFEAGLLQEEVHLYMIQPDGQNLKNLTPDFRYPGSDGIGTWSPDSRCLVFSAFSNADNPAPVTSIYVIDTQTGSKVKITDDLTFYAAGSWAWPTNDNISCASIFQGK